MLIHICRGKRTAVKEFGCQQKKNLCTFCVTSVYCLRSFQHKIQMAEKKSVSERKWRKQKKNASVLLQTGEFKCGKNSAVSQTRKEQHSGEESKAILKKRKGGEELIVFFLCTMYPSPSLWTQGPCTCQHTCAHMFLVLRDRLWRKYRKTVSVCALGGGRERRGWSNN